MFITANMKVGGVLRLRVLQHGLERHRRWKRSGLAVMKSAPDLEHLIGESHRVERLDDDIDRAEL